MLRLCLMWKFINEIKMRMMEKSELRKQNLELKEKIIKTNSFLKEVAKMLNIETDGLGYDGLQLSLDDFETAIQTSKQKALNLDSVINWVDITVKMPESGHCVLLYSKDGGVAEGAYISTKGHFEQWRWNCVQKGITHWAELPKPPCL